MTSFCNPTRMIRLVMVALALTLTAHEADAQRKAGRSGAAFLKVGVGARAAALGSAATAFNGDANQIFWNPAGTALDPDQTLSASFSYNQWIADLSHSAAAVGYNLGNAGTATIGFQVFGLSDISANRQNGYTDPILQELVTDNETSSTFNFQNVSLNAAYSRFFFDRLALGAGVKLISESIDSETATAVAFDFGSMYRVGVAGWQLSARVSNLGTPLTFFNQDNPLPITFSIGSTIYPVSTETARLMVAVDATKPIDAQQLFYGGAELSLYDLVFIRGGYKFNYTGVDDGGTSVRDAVDTSIEGASLGAGIQAPVSGYIVGFDYAFTQMDLLDNTHRFTLSLGL
ncbi:MAG: PorV/PorQ family protein [Bacteroidota bacterium]